MKSNELAVYWNHALNALSEADALLEPYFDINDHGGPNWAMQASNEVREARTAIRILMRKLNVTSVQE